MQFRIRFVLFLIAIVAFVFVQDAAALRENPGSCLLFPYYDTTGVTLSVHTITNVGEDDIFIRLVFINSQDCGPKDFWWELTAGDTFTFGAHGLVPWQERGFLYVYVVEEQYSTHEKDADVLVGQEIVLGTWDHRLVQFSLNAISFQAKNLTPDGKLHLDGVEFTAAPKTLYFPRFFGQESALYSKVILINLTGGKYFDAWANVLIYNDNEYAFSDLWRMDCFDLQSLENMSGATQKAFLLSTNHDLNEPLPFHWLAETGTMRLTGNFAKNNQGTVVINDASILAVLIEGFGTLGYTGADLPFQIEDSNTHKNAMLWSTNSSGT